MTPRELAAHRKRLHDMRDPEADPCCPECCNTANPQRRPPTYPDHVMAGPMPHIASCTICRAILRWPMPELEINLYLKLMVDFARQHHHLLPLPAGEQDARPNDSARQSDAPEQLPAHRPTDPS